MKMKSKSQPDRMKRRRTQEIILKSSEPNSKKEKRIEQEIKEKARKLSKGREMKPNESKPNEN